MVTVGVVLITYFLDLQIDQLYNSFKSIGILGINPGLRIVSKNGFEAKLYYLCI